MRHKLTHIDPATRKAVCSVCGPCKIKSRGRRDDGTTRWRCMTNHPRRSWRKKVQPGDVCEQCGFIPEDLCQLDVHRHLDEDSEILCANCHRLVTKRGE